MLFLPKRRVTQMQFLIPPLNSSLSILIVFWQQEGLEINDELSVGGNVIVTSPHVNYFLLCGPVYNCRGESSTVLVLMSS